VLLNGKKSRRHFKAMHHSLKISMHILHKNCIITFYLCTRLVLLRLIIPGVFNRHLKGSVIFGSILAAWHAAQAVTMPPAPFPPRTPRYRAYTTVWQESGFPAGCGGLSAGRGQERRRLGTLGCPRPPAGAERGASTSQTWEVCWPDASPRPSAGWVRGRLLGGCVAVCWVGA